MQIHIPSKKIGLNFGFHKPPSGLEANWNFTIDSEQDTEWTDFDEMLERHFLKFFRKKKKIVANSVRNANGPGPRVFNGNTST